MGENLIKNKNKYFIIALISVLFVIPTVLADTPPYPSGAAGQWTEGTASVNTTTITPSTGRINMYGIAAGEVSESGRADSWGKFGINYITATETETKTAYSAVRYNGQAYISALYYMYGYSSAGAWIYQYIKVYDTSNWQLVGQASQTVLSQTVTASIPFVTESYQKTFNPNTDLYSMSVNFNAVQGHTYAVEVSVECQVAVSAGGGAIGSGLYNFWNTNGYYVQVDYISCT